MQLTIRKPKKELQEYLDYLRSLSSVYKTDDAIYATAYIVVSFNTTQGDSVWYEEYAEDFHGIDEQEYEGWKKELISNTMKGISYILGDYYDYGSIDDYPEGTTVTATLILPDDEYDVTESILELIYTED